MCKRRLLVELVKKHDVEIAEAARQCCISRPTAYKWLKRFDAGGYEALEEQSRARRDPGRFDGELAESLVLLRLLQPNWGPRKLIDWFKTKATEEGELSHLVAELPAPSTVGELLDRWGLTRKRSRVPSHYPLRYAGPTPRLANWRWTIDFKGNFRLQNGSQCYPLTLRDAASRKLLLVKALPSTHSAPVQKELEGLMRKFGMPFELQSDGGTPFATRGLACLSALSVWLLKLDVMPVLSRPGKPQDNGAHERMHKDLKVETTRPPGEDFADQQRKFDTFTRIFNEERPHEALSGQAPDHRWTPSFRLFPEQMPKPEYPGHWEVRRVNARSNTISWKDEVVKVNDALGGEDIAFEPYDDDLYRVHFYRFTIGVFDARGERPVLISPPREAGHLAA